MDRRRVLVFFLLAVFVQTAILVGVPARKALVRQTGKTIYVPIEPVDPYSVLSGYYAILSYEFTNPWEARVPALPESIDAPDAFVVLEPGEDRLWRPVRYAFGKPPEGMEPGQVLLKGRHTGWRHLEFGIEEFYIPEARRQELADALRDRKVQNYAVVRVDRRGNAALVALQAGGKRFE